MGPPAKTDTKRTSGLFDLFAIIRYDAGAETKEARVPQLLDHFPKDGPEVQHKMLGKFCFPYVSYENEPESEMFTFTLTGASATAQYGFCRYMPVPSVKLAKGPQPTDCLVILSQWPWFEFFDVLLESLVALRECNKDNEVLIVLESLMCYPKPLPGERIKVYTSDPDAPPIELICGDRGRLPSVPDNMNLNTLLSRLNPRNILVLFASLLFERRVLFTSSKLSTLTACAHCVSTLLYPLYWQHVFIPVLPASLIDYVSAPMPFVIGVHSSLMKTVRMMPLDEVVIVNVDEDRVETTTHDINAIPMDLQSTLLATLRTYSSLGVNDVVARSFLTFFASCFGNYRDHITVDPSGAKAPVFKQDGLVATKPKPLQPFLTNFLQLQMFQQFMGERLAAIRAGKPMEEVFERFVAGKLPASKLNTSGRLLTNVEGVKIAMQYKSENARQAWAQTKTKLQSNLQVKRESLQTTIKALSPQLQEAKEKWNTFKESAKKKDSDPDMPFGLSRNETVKDTRSVVGVHEAATQRARSMSVGSGAAAFGSPKRGSDASRTSNLDFITEGAAPTESPAVAAPDQAPAQARAVSAAKGA
eukprot:Colp12_sorted_trinity150504_noHs@15435